MLSTKVFIIIYGFLIALLFHIDEAIDENNHTKQMEMELLGKYEIPDKITSLFNSKFKRYWYTLNKNNRTINSLGRVLNAMKKGNQKKIYKEKRLKKFLYPLFMGALIAKLIFIPFILKVLTIFSSSAFLVSKLALAVSSLVALKWLLNDSTKSKPERTEVVYASSGTKSLEPYRYDSGHIYFADDDDDDDGDDDIDQIWSSSQQIKSKFIPLHSKDQKLVTTHKAVNNYNVKAPFL